MYEQIYWLSYSKINRDHICFYFQAISASQNMQEPRLADVAQQGNHYCTDLTHQKPSKEWGIDFFKMQDWYLPVIIAPAKCHILISRPRGPAKEKKKLYIKSNDNKSGVWKQFKGCWHFFSVLFKANNKLVFICPWKSLRETKSNLQ